MIVRWDILIALVVWALVYATCMGLGIVLGMVP
jgi:hypothetical protein